MNLDRSNIVSFTSDWSRGRYVTQFCTVIHAEKSSSRGAVRVKEGWGGVGRGDGEGREKENEWYARRKHFDFHLLPSCLKCSAAAAAAKSLQSCPTLCNPIDGNLPGFSVHGILQARTLEWVAISFSNAWKWKVKVKSLSRVWLLSTLWTAAYQAPPSTGFSGQQYWSGVPLPSPKMFFYQNVMLAAWRIILWQ